MKDINDEYSPSELNSRIVLKDEHKCKYCKEGKTDEHICTKHKYLFAYVFDSGDTEDKVFAKQYAARWVKIPDLTERDIVEEIKKLYLDEEN